MTSLGFASLARAADRRDLEEAISRFKAGKYEEAAPLFESLLRLPLPPGALEDNPRRMVFREARPIYAATLVFKGEPADLIRADEVILEHYVDDPFYEQAAGEFHENVERRFRDVRATHRAVIDERKNVIFAQRTKRRQALARFKAAREKWIRDLKTQAGEKIVLETRSRWVAMIPFGVGQFYNDSSELGVFFTISEALAVTATVVSFGWASDRANVDPAVTEPVDLDGVKSQFETARTVNWVSFAATSVLVIAGVIEAQVSFKGSETRAEQRHVDPEPTLEPSVVVTETGGVTAGVQLRF